MMMMMMIIEMLVTFQSLFTFSIDVQTRRRGPPAASNGQKKSKESSDPRLESKLTCPCGCITCVRRCHLNVCIAPYAPSITTIQQPGLGIVHAFTNLILRATKNFDYSLTLSSPSTCIILLPKYQLDGPPLDEDGMYS